ncbi:polysaccharide pyruvyl transferase family protein [Bacillus kwashiorkori]|uniref:polysaccharide pyruvyl transferase family protein n=1 Tax=Bacillus kwashiorkori TaxID=1522318 RepID=UPI000781A904|nr:polysaccharide pyruvyl transferase family protein [Bacillus kwashiorkori]
MEKVLLISCAGYDNFGDEAMFKEIYKDLKSRGKSITVAYYSFDLKKTKERHPNVNFIKLKDLPRRLGSIRKPFMDITSQIYAAQYDALYITGAGNLTSLYTKHIENIYFLVSAFKKKNKYIEFRPQSVGPFFGSKKSIDESYVKEIVKIADKFYVRDYISYEYIKETSENVKLSNDEAWDLEIIKPKEFNPSILENKKLVGVSIRPFRTEKEYLIKWFKALVDELNSKGYTPFFIPICYNEQSPEYQDNYFLKTIIGEKGIFLEDLIDINSLEPENIKYFVNMCQKCIGLSYHFNVFSLSLGKRVISLYYEDYYKVKNLGLQKAFGNTENVVNPLKVKVKEVIDLLEK